MNDPLLSPVAGPARLPKLLPAAKIAACHCSLVLVLGAIAYGKLYSMLLQENELPVC